MVTANTGTQDANGSSVQSRVPPAAYMSGKQFVEMFDKYAEHGLPAVFDLSYFGSMSGSLIAQIRGSMRHFDLIDEAYVPTDSLRELVQAGADDRKLLLEVLVKDKYADALSLGSSATSGQLNKVFTERGINGATVDKAVAFFLYVTDYLDIPTSAHFKKRKSVAPRKTRKKAATPASPVVEPTPVQAVPKDQKSQYVDMLMKLAQEGDPTERSDLLNRIEKALGIEDADASGGDG